MKLKQKILALFLLICTILFLFVACGKQEDLNKMGMEMTAILDEMVKSDKYLQIYNIELEDVAESRQKFIANDYDTPIKKFSITYPNSEKMLDNLISTGEIEIDDLNSLSDSIKEQILQRVSPQGIIYNINSIEDHSLYNYILRSVYVAKKQFDNCKINDNIIYLYVFETDMPIVITFESKGDSVCAEAQFLLVKEKNTLSELREIFEPFGCEVNPIYN